MYHKTRLHSTPVHFANLLEGLMNPELTSAEHKLKHNALINILENEQQYQLQIVAPGLKKEDFKIEVENGKLSISFEHEDATTEKQEKWIRQEFSMPSFKRSFSLNEKIDSSAIQAVYENGILNLRLPKKEKETVKSHSIAVQ
jgi:HSP20 family protein